MGQINNRTDEPWKLALEGSGLGTWEWHVPSNEFFYSPKLSEMLGQPGKATSLPGWIDLVHPEDFQRAKDQVGGILKGEAQKRTVEYRVRCMDGTHKWVRVTGVVRSREGDGKPVSIIGLVTDLSDYPDYMVIKMVQTIPAPILIIQDGRVCYANLYMRLRLGYTSQELFAMDPWGWVHTKMRETIRGQILASLEGKTAFSSFEADLPPFIVPSSELAFL